MSTNVYDAEETIHFSSDSAYTRYGYHISTSYGGFNVYPFESNEGRRAFERAIARLVPDPDRVAAFAALAYAAENEGDQYVGQEMLEEEVQDEDIQERIWEIFHEIRGE